MFNRAADTVSAWLLDRAADWSLQQDDVSSGAVLMTLGGLWSENKGYMQILHMVFVLIHSILGVALLFCQLRIK